MNHGSLPDNFNNNNLSVKELRECYDNVVAAVDPIRSDETIAAVIGGWEVIVDFTYAAGLGRNHQFLFTLWDSEPWVQVMMEDKSGALRVRQLIT